jgi:uncharacterized Zn-finger protein
MNPHPAPLSEDTLDPAFMGQLSRYFVQRLPLLNDGQLVELKQYFQNLVDRIDQTLVLKSSLLDLARHSSNSDLQFLTSLACSDLFNANPARNQPQTNPTPTESLISSDMLPPAIEDMSPSNMRNVCVSQHLAAQQLQTPVHSMIMPRNNRRQSRSLNPHMLETGEYSCPYPDCHRKYKYMSNYRSHARVHIDPHVCEFCGKKFGRKANYLVHLKMHSELNPFRCAHCEKRFAFHERLQEHVAQEHNVFAAKRRES